MNIWGVRGHAIPDNFLGLGSPTGAVATPPPPLSPPLNLGSCQTYAKITRAQRFFMHLSTQEKLNTEHGCEGRSQHCTDPKPNLAIKFTEIYGIHNTIFALSCSKKLEFVITICSKSYMCISQLLIRTKNFEILGL